MADTARKPDFRPKLVNVRLLHPHPLNLRTHFDKAALEGLAASIADDGVEEPLIIQRRPEGQRGFWILAGERRWRSAIMAGETVLPAVERPDRGFGTAVKIFLKENGQREPLNPIEKARGFAYLRDEEGETLAQISKETGFAQSVISDSLALLQLTAQTQEDVATGKISAADALKAVRQVRRQGGRAARQPVSWEPDHFSARHPLAAAVRQRCKAEGHTNRRKVGKVGCGQCWEDVLREDQDAQRAAGIAAPADPAVGAAA